MTSLRNNDSSKTGKPQTRDHVMIVGAGPTGLVLALWLTKLGIQVRIIDKTSEPGTTSRAMLVQARTLELYSQLDLATGVVDAGYHVVAMNVWANGSHKARIAMGAMGEGLSPYPFLEVFPQDRHEKLLVQRLEALGVAVERQTELCGFTQADGFVSMQLKNAAGEESVDQASYLVGCDGARSLVRTTIGADFPGGTYNQVFYVADIEATGPAMNGETHVELEGDGFLMLFGIGGAGARLIGIVDDDLADRAEELTFHDLSSKPMEALQLKIDKVNWFSTYRVHHRVAAHFRDKRVFLAGDAGHIHSPAGGQGMNTGIGDSINLAWKLAAVIQDHAGDELLDTYELERLPFARHLVETTDRLFSYATAKGPVADFVRTHIAPALLPIAFHVPIIPGFMFRNMSQILIQYRDSPLSEGAAGRIHGGDRLPWVDVDGRNNFDSLRVIEWQIHVYGTPANELNHWCDSHNIALQTFSWTKAHEAAGLERDAAYLLRPDTYVACAVSGGRPDVLDNYISQRSPWLADLLLQKRSEESLVDA